MGAREIAQDALQMWQDDTATLFKQLGETNPGVMERGVAALVQPPSAPGAAAAFRAQLGAAQSPAEMDAILKQRMALIGQTAALREFGAIPAPYQPGPETNPYLAK